MAHAPCRRARCPPSRPSAHVVHLTGVQPTSSASAAPLLFRGENSLKRCKQTVIAASKFDHCMGEKGTACMKELVKCSTPGVTAAIVSRHSGTARLALRLHVGAGTAAVDEASGNFKYNRTEATTKALATTKPRVSRCPTCPPAAHPTHASWHACALGYRHSSMTLFSIPAVRQWARYTVLTLASKRDCWLWATGPALALACAPFKPNAHSPFFPATLTDFCAAEEDQLADGVGRHLVRDALLKCRQQARHAIIPRLELQFNGGSLQGGLKVMCGTGSSAALGSV